MTVGRTWTIQGTSPMPTDDALVGRVTGWPDDPATGPSPLRWARVLMAGVNAAVGDPEWQVDPLSLRLTEAWITVVPSPPPDPDRAPVWTDLVVPGSPVRVEVDLRQVVALGALTGLRLHLEVRAGSGIPLADAEVTVAGTGPGLVGGTRPEAPAVAVVPAPPTGEEGPAHERREVVRSGAVDAFSSWVRDPTPIHTDRDAARAAGLRGPIAPGMFVLGLQAAAVGRLAHRSVVGVGARFVRPAVVGDQLDLTLRSASDRAAPGRCLVAVSGPEGPVVRRAWVDLGPHRGSATADGFH